MTCIGMTSIWKRCPFEPSWKEAPTRVDYRRNNCEICQSKVREKPQSRPGLLCWKETLTNLLPMNASADSPKIRLRGVLRLIALLALCFFSRGAVHRSYALPNSQDEKVSGDNLPGVLSGGADHAIKRWDMTGKLAVTVGSHEDTVNVLLISTGASRDILLSAGADGALKLWSLSEMRSLLTIPTGQDAVLSLAMSPNGALIATGGANSHITLWDRVSGRRLFDVKAHSGGVHALQFTSDGMLLVSGSADRSIRIWRVVGEPRRAPQLEYRSNIVAHDDTVTALALSSDDRTLASVSADGYLKLWRMDGGLITRERVCGQGVNALAFSPDGRMLATGDEEGKIRFWNPANGASIPFNASHDRGVTALAWAADGKILVSGGADKTVRYWNASNGQKLKSIAAHDGAVKALVVVP